MWGIMMTLLQAAVYGEMYGLCNRIHKSMVILVFMI